ncbi:605_t:CDS:1, partial [Scutellospora calospora]
MNNLKIIKYLEKIHEEIFEKHNHNLLEKYYKEIPEKILKLTDRMKIVIECMEKAINENGN